MTLQVPQNFDNHRVVPKPWFVSALLVFAGVISAVLGLLLLRTAAGLYLIGAGVVLNGLGSLLGLGLLRRYATKLQDRIIRAEMRMRLAGLLPPELQESIQHLTIKQLVGLRFASDDELPALLTQVLREDLQDPAAIKRLVQDWQGDYDRV
jgi:hypothetical protein